jgi:uncharacterized protein (DUF488 family)
MIYTVGHSTRSLGELVDVLRPAGVEALVDVRTAPGSRRHPQFGREALAAGLSEAGIAYRHEKALGGFRRPQAESANTGWEHLAFRGYADYMSTPEFARALARLESEARERPTSVMCAEAQWWRCHRRLISDALVVRGWKVLHLGLGGGPAAHELTPFAVVGADGALRYPPAQGTLIPPRQPSPPR